jgi:hypothetical protein
MPSRRSSDRSSNDYFDLMELPHPSHDQMVINGLDKIAKKTGLNGEKLDKIIQIMEKEIKHTKPKKKPKPTMFNIGRLTASRKAPVTPLSLTTAQGKTKKKRRKPKKKKRKSTRKK